MSFPWKALFFDFHTMPANPDVGKEFDMKAIVDQFERIGAEFVVFPARCNLGTAYYYTDIGIRHAAMERDLLKELTEECHKRNILISAYINAGLSHEEGLQKREWQVLRKDGRTYGSDPMNNFFRQMCYDTEYGDHLVNMAVEAVQHCGVDGIFIDCLQTQPCIGIECLDKMAKEGVDWKDEDELYAYNYRKIIKMAKRISEAIKKIKPDALQYFNGIGYETQKDIGNYLEFECLPTGGWGYETLQVGARYLRTLNMPVLNMSGRFHRSWGDFGGIRTKASLEYDCLYGVANCLGTTVGDHFHPRGDINYAVMDMDADIYAKLSEIEPWCRDAEALTDMAIIMSKPYPGLDWYGENRMKLFQREWNAICAASRMLCELNYQFDVVSQASDWDKYQVLIMPDFTPLDKENEKRIAKHLQKGGKILASAESGLNESKDAFVFSEWGLEYLEESPYDISFLSNSDEIATGQPDMPIALYERGQRVAAKENTAVLAEIIAPYYNQIWDGRQAHYYQPPDKNTGDPAATLSEKVAYIANPVFTSYYENAPVPMRQLVANLLEKLIAKPLLRCPDAPSFARITATSQAGRRMVHYLAYMPEHRLKSCEMIEEPLTVLKQRIQLREDNRKIEKVYLAPSGEELEFERSADGYICVTVEQITGYTLLVFEE